MSRRRLAYSATAVVVGLVLVAAIIWIFRPAVILGEPAPRGDNVYAYTTKREFVLMHGDREVSRIPREFSDIDSHENKIVWTHNGRHVVFFADGLKEVAAPDQTLVVVDVNTGDMKKIKCSDCVDITPVGDDEVLAMLWTDMYMFKRFNLSAAGTGQSSTLELAFHFDVEAFAASSRNYIATRKTYLSPRYEQQFELTPIDGSGGQNIGSFASGNSYIYAAVNEATGVQSPTFAFATRPNAGECMAVFPIFVSHLKGEFFETDMSATTPAGFVAGEGSGIDVQDLWWGRDGKLRASISVWTCDPKGSPTAKMSQVGPSRYSLWKLEGRKWMRDSEAPQGFVREVGSENYLTLEYPSCVLSGGESNGDSCELGVVSYQAGGAKKHVADDVLLISSPVTSG